MNSILITGGSGFIGTNLIDLLISRGYNNIINYDKNPPSNHNHNKIWVEGNIMDGTQLDRVFIEYKPDTIVHLAARTDTLSNILEDYNENHIGTKHILDVIIKYPFIQNVIITSTQYVYKSEVTPFPIDMYDFKPHTIYGQSKVLTEQFTHNANLACRWTIVRPTNIWGPWHMRYPNELWKVIDKGMYFHPVNHPVIRTYGYVKNIVHQIFQILVAPTELVDRKMFYLGDEPIDSYIWLNEISLQLAGKKIKKVPKFIFQGAALAGDLLRKAHIPFPLYTERFKNMVEDYPAPTKLTIELFGSANYDLKQNVEETIIWINSDGKRYFDYWRNK